MSNVQELRDASGLLLGKIIQSSNGTFGGLDARGNLKGTYNPKNNETRDASGILVGKGNLLSGLITAS